MKKNIKILFIIFIIITFIGSIYSIIFFLPNEIGFKIVNKQKNFLKAEKLFPKWELVSKNNYLGQLYEQKKYSILSKNLKNISEKTCSLKNQKISEVCANIFYLEGLTLYQKGKELNDKQQKEFFEKSILAFTKVMIMTDKTSKPYIWAKENIDFILNKFQENQKKDNKSQNKPKKDNKKEKEEKQQNKNNSSKNKEQESETKNKDDKNSKNKEKQQSSEEENDKKEGKSKQQSDKNKDNNKPKPSRLPTEMQQQLEQIQKQLEQTQKKSQKGFNRSKSAAEKNNLNNQNPFNDPFFQDFFGNDPFFQNPFEKKFNKNISNNSDEKDW